MISLIGHYLIGVAIDQFIATSDVAGLIYISLLMLTTYVAGTLASIGSGWIMATIGFSLCIGLIAFFISGEYKSKLKPKEKPKYQGQPIVLKGGKKDE